MALNYYDTTNVITTSQPVELDPESILYQSEDVWKKYKRLSRKITVVCVGPGILYVRSSHDGTYFSEESVIYEGQSKDYDEIYVLKLRSPSANLRYRVTEYNVSTVSGQQFTGSRFKERRDRNGVVVFQDDYESPIIKFETFTTTSGTGIITRSNVIAYAGDFSIRTQAGPSANYPAVDTVDMVYRHPDFHIGKIANQVNFAVDPPLNTIAEVNLELDYFDGTNKYFSIAAFDTLGRMFIATPNSIFPFYDITFIKGGIIVFPSIFSWNLMKLTIDIAALKYVAAFVNGQRIDLSGFDLPKIPSLLATHIVSIVQNTTIQKGNPQDIYFDNYLFTEDETLV